MDAIFPSFRGLRGKSVLPLAEGFKFIPKKKRASRKNTKRLRNRMRGENQMNDRS